MQEERERERGESARLSDLSVESISRYRAQVRGTIEPKMQRVSIESETSCV